LSVPDESYSRNVSCPPHLISTILLSKTREEGVIRILKSKKDRQHNGQKKKTDNTMAKRKRTNNDPQNITPKTKDRATQTSLITGG